VSQLRQVSRAIAFAVARRAQADGVAPKLSEDELATRIDAHVWQPVYRPYRRAAVKSR